MSSDSSPRMDDFVAKIVSDPKNPPNIMMLSGYVGASSEEGHTRLYSDKELSSYVDVPNDAILHSEPLEVGSTIWIKRDAQIKAGRGMAQAAQAAQARYFQGSIMKAYGEAAAAGIQAQADAEAAGQIGVQASQLFLCRTEQGVACLQPSVQVWRCPSLVDCPPSVLLFQCKTQMDWCAQPSVTTLCPTTNVNQCPSLVDGCPSTLLQCRTQMDWCAQPSVTTLCPSITANQCPSLVDACRSAMIQCESLVCPTQGQVCSSFTCPSQLVCPSEVCWPGRGNPGTPLR